MGNYAKHDEPLIFSALLQVLSMFAATRDVDLLALVQPLGVTVEDIMDRDARVPYECLVVVWEELMRRFPDEPLGLEYAKMIDLENLGLIGLIVMHSPTLGVALERSTKMQALLDPMMVYEHVSLGDEVEVRVDHEPRVVAMREPLEMMLSMMHSTMKASVGGEAALSHVTFAHERRHPMELYVDAFGLEPEFGAEHFALRFPAYALEFPLKYATPAVADYLEKQLHEFLPPSEAVGFVGQVERVLDEQLSDGIDQAGVARELAVSVRTLQRRLREEDATFSAVLDRVRRERAQELLETGCAVYEVAYALGYSEPSTFFRWFKREYGVTPSEWRE